MAASVSLRGGESEPSIRLTGLVGFAGERRALLETRLPRGQVVRMILGEGEREGEIEVTKLDLNAGRVQVREGGRTIDLSLSTNKAPGILVVPSEASSKGAWLGEPASIRLEGANQDQVFLLYQALTRRTVIRPTSLPGVAWDMASKEPVTIADVTRAVERALAEKEIVVQPDGDKFALVGPAGDVARITSEVRERFGVKTRTSSSSGDLARDDVAAQARRDPEMLQAGCINFPGTDLNQVLSIFQELAGKTVLRPAALPAPTIRLQTGNALTRDEAIYAFTAVLAINGVSVLPVNDKFVFAFPAAEGARAKAVLSRKTSALEPIGKSNLGPGEGSLSADFPQVKAMYEELSGRSIELEPGLPNARIFLKLQTPVTPKEAVFALDLLLAWHDLAVVSQGEGRPAKMVRMRTEPITQ